MAKTTERIGPTRGIAGTMDVILVPGVVKGSRDFFTGQISFGNSPVFLTFGYIIAKQNVNRN